MRYIVSYFQPKKKRGYYSQQSATFMKIEDAMFWESIMKEKGCKDVNITVK